MAHVIKVERATKDGKKRHAWKVRYRDPDRVEKAKTFDKKGDAEKFASTIETDILRGDYVDPRAGKVALNDWAAKWVATLSVKLRTRLSYESLLRSRILPTFGKRQLAGLRRSDIQEWIASMLAEGLSPSRARQAVIVLRLMLDAAVDDRLIARNPADRIKLPKIPHKEAEYFDPAVADQLVTRSRSSSDSSSACSPPLASATEKRSRSDAATSISCAVVCASRNHWPRSAGSSSLDRRSRTPSEPFPCRRR